MDELLLRVVRGDDDDVGFSERACGRLRLGEFAPDQGTDQLHDPFGFLRRLGRIAAVPERLEVQPRFHTVDRPLLCSGCRRELPGVRQL